MRGVCKIEVENKGEITQLTSIAQPDISVITSIGSAHMENLGGKLQIAQAKCEILEGTKENGLFLYNYESKEIQEVLCTLDTENKKQKQFLMQNEEKELYGKSKYNYFISGHLHNYSVEEIGGVQYIRLPSLSGTDNWHNEMGFVTSIKGAIAFEFDTDKGLVNKIIFNL